MFGFRWVRVFRFEFWVEGLVLGFGVGCIVFEFWIWGFAVWGVEFKGRGLGIGCWGADFGEGGFKGFSGSRGFVVFGVWISVGLCFQVWGSGFGFGVWVLVCGIRSLRLEV